jgi:hypothetical protein
MFANTFLAAMAILVALPAYPAAPRRAVAPPSQSGPSSKIKKEPACVPAGFASQPTATPQWVPLYGSSSLSVAVTGTSPSVSWYTWGDEVFVGSGATFAVAPSKHTCYYAVVRNECGLQESLGAWVMIATPLLTQNPTATPSTITAGQPVTLETGGGTGQGTLTYKWFTSDGTQIGTGKKLVVRPTVTTSYYYKIVTDLESDPSIQVTVTVK